MGLLEANAGLKGKVAVVLGGCGEIQGKAITLALADAGVTIAACDIDEEAVGPSSRRSQLAARGSCPCTPMSPIPSLDRFYDRVAANSTASNRRQPAGWRKTLAVRRHHARAECARYSAQLRLRDRQRPARDSLDSARRPRRQHHQLHHHRGPSRRRDLRRLCRRQGGDHEFQPCPGGRTGAEGSASI